MNIVTLIGRLAHDPEMKLGSKGKDYTSFSVFSVKRYVNDRGELKAKNNLLYITAFSGMAKWVTDNLKKGDMIVVQGSISSQMKNEKYQTYIVANQIDPISQIDRRDGQKMTIEDYKKLHPDYYKKEDSHGNR